jgi:ribosomal protein L12E/L44/L45/RPP1/RPP2
LRPNLLNLLAGSLVLFLFLLLAGKSISSEMVTITGTINTDYEIVTDDGQVYQVVENLKGKEVVELVDRKVRITGTVRKEGGEKKIRVASYEVLD